MRKSVLVISLILLTIVSVLSVAFVRNYNSTPVKVGIVDTYLNDNSASDYNIKRAYNLVTNSANNHGDMIVDIFRNQDKNSELYYVCAMDENGVGTIKDIVDSIKWLEQQDVDIICLSLTTLTDDELLREAISQLVEKDVVIVAACLNYSNTKSFPASYPGVVSVANCSNDSATISITDKKTKEKLLSYKWNDCSTSSLTAFITGNLSAKLFREYCDIQEFVDSFKC